MIVGLESVVYGVADFDAGCRFWSDFGLEPVARSDRQAVFETAEGATIVLRPAGDSDLPPAPVGGPTAREIVWGVTDEDGVAAIGRRLADQGPVRREPDGTVRAADPAGYGIAFRVTRRRALAEEPPLFNAPGAARRVNRPAPLYERAHPLHMAHVVLLCPEIEAGRRFYMDVLGFRMTDSYPGNGYFLRCDGATDHHNLFLLRRGDAIGFHHLAFDMRDIHEVFGGGIYMQSQGWETHLGPGRHPISSAYFWYFRNPCGGAVEYDFDTDVITDEWQPRVFQPSAQTFAEWSLEAGIERYGGVQKTRA
jgi:catechol 2,3-dioxygenase-like lactoylglutathione lyase family enzyme